MGCWVFVAGEARNKHPTPHLVETFERKSWILLLPLAGIAGLWDNVSNMGRWIRFVIAILIGVAGGLFYGWVISPAEFTNTTPETLRIDYKTDYVLMVSEIYHQRKDLNLAINQLSMVGKTPPGELALQAIQFGKKVGYSTNDLNLMQALSSAIQSYNPVLSTNAP